VGEENGAFRVRSSHWDAFLGNSGQRIGYSFLRRRGCRSRSMRKLLPDSSLHVGAVADAGLAFASDGGSAQLFALVLR
jgi:hypothetical protein